MSTTEDVDRGERCRQLLKAIIVADNAEKRSSNLDKRQIASLAKAKAINEARKFLESLACPK